MSGPIHLLIVDDEPSIREPLCENLQANGFITTSAQDAAQARILLAEKTFDLIVLDRMMPGEDGVSLCGYIRQEIGTPVILLTAMAEEEDRINGLEGGADDYLAKPFNPRELIARIRSVLHRSQSYSPPALTKVKFGDWTLDLVQGELSRSDGVVETLSSGELDLLRVFIAAPNETLSRDKILSQTKGREAFPFERSIDVMISRLRHKIEETPSDPSLIKTIWGGGYRFTPKVLPL